MKNLFLTVSALAAANPAGFTYDLVNGSFPSSGYVIALAETQNSFGPEGLQKCLDLITSGKTKATCIGGWLDNESGLYYYDASIIVDDLDIAIQLGKANGQIAIFNLNTFEEIRL